MVLTLIAVLIMIGSFFGVIMSIAYFLGHIEILFGFNGETKETLATVVGFNIYASDDPGDRDYYPVIEYYNEYKGQTERKELFNSGMLAKQEALTKGQKQRIVNVGDQVKVQYTCKKVRVIDATFKSPKSFHISWYIRPLIISVVIGLVGFILLVISIV